MGTHGETHGLERATDSFAVKGKENFKRARAYEREWNREKAFKHYLLAALEGSTRAQYTLGMMYLSRRVPQRLGNLGELLQAYKWFLLASQDFTYRVPLKQLRYRFEGTDPEEGFYLNLKALLNEGKLKPETKIVMSNLSPFYKESNLEGKT